MELLRRRMNWIRRPPTYAHLFTEAENSWEIHMDTKKITYQLHPDSADPTPGQYLVTLSQRDRPRHRVLSVMMIRQVRKINHRTITDHQAYALELLDRPDLKPYTEFELTGSSVNVWVRGDEALPYFWLRREKPK